ncbi:MAG: UDP-N-acetyl-D-glucosamine 2-epimerase, UDP-hydrolysing [Betaproteobacteria bacterium RIFCSPLOWO2_12_FULL_63_13]|nr:MAG: UDP-N-acetyl-D-glucosamine 2-epimerase, UDP-hydrolysing [Betaproteobacteria bacterium RIFCSPLOWO2_12_FULL_63_13]
MNKRKICIVTGSRAEYGLLYWLMKEIQADSSLQLQLIATGMHLSPEFGLTYSQIEDDGFVIDAKIEMLLSSDTASGTSKSMGLGMIGFADALTRLAPDIVVVLGDRFEILAAAQSASLQGIAVAHISGGEVTVGAVDDWIRHSISKTAWWHFVAAEQYRRRVIQLGESPERVFNVGDPGLDSIRQLPLLERAALASDLGIALHRPLFLVTYHPATLGSRPPEQEFAEVLAALDAFPEASIVMTKPNADAGARQLAAMAEDWTSRRQSPTLCVASLGQLRYLSVMRHCDAVIGNSSSGIVEAPALKVPTVNIGNRQAGRLLASSIIDCQENREAIAGAIHAAMSPDFKKSLPGTVSLYGDSEASRQIKQILANSDLPSSLAKRFHDV